MTDHPSKPTCLRSYWMPPSGITIILFLMINSKMIHTKIPESWEVRSINQMKAIINFEWLMKLVLRSDIWENEIPELFNESFWNYLLEKDLSGQLQRPSWSVIFSFLTFSYEGGLKYRNIYLKRYLKLIKDSVKAWLCSWKHMHWWQAVSRFSITFEKAFKALTNWK